MRGLDQGWGLSHDPISEDSMGIYGLSLQKSAQTLDILHETSEDHSFPRTPWMAHEDTGLGISGLKVL